MLSRREVNNTCVQTCINIRRECKVLLDLVGALLHQAKAASEAAP